MSISNMAEQDLIIRATSSKVPLRFVAVNITQAAQQIAQKHGAKGQALVLLAETSVASLLLSAGLKMPGTLSLRLEFSGDISMVQADSTPQGLVRAMIPHEELAKTGDFELLLSPQRLKTIKIDDKARIVQESIVESASLSMGANLAAYMLQSEQIRSAVGIEARANSTDPSKLDYAVGFLIEAFPDLEDKHIEIMEQVVRTMPTFDSFFDGATYRIHDMLDQLAGPYEIQILREIKPVAYCPCSKIRSLATLKAFGDDELRSMIAQGETLEIVCDFCRTAYEISVEEITQTLQDRS